VRVATREGPGGKEPLGAAAKEEDPTDRETRADSIMWATEVVGVSVGGGIGEAGTDGAGGY